MALQTPLLTPLRGQRIAVCEAGPLTPDRDAGARAVADLIDSARALGAVVAFLDESEGNIVSHLESFDPTVIVISRPGLFLRLHPQLAHVSVPMMYLAHDLHHVRLALQHPFDPSLGERAIRVMKMVEAYCFREATLSVLPTPREAVMARQLFGDVAVTWMRYFAMPTYPVHPLRTDRIVVAPTSTQRRLIFVGGAAHAPNRDGVTWFIKNVWPELRGGNDNVYLDVCGAWDPVIVSPLMRDGITFHGPVTEDELDLLMNAASIGLAPLRFGAGMKRKTLDYLARGLPVVSTEFGIEGLCLDRETEEPIPGVSVAHTAREWIAAVRELLEPSARWNQDSAEAQAFVERDFSSDTYKVGLVRILTD